MSEGFSMKGLEQQIREILQQSPLFHTQSQEEQEDLVSRILHLYRVPSGS